MTITNYYQRQIAAKQVKIKDKYTKYEIINKYDKDIETSISLFFVKLLFP